MALPKQPPTYATWQLVRLVMGGSPRAIRSFTTPDGFLKGELENIDIFGPLMETLINIFPLLGEQQVKMLRGR